VEAYVEAPVEAYAEAHDPPYLAANSVARYRPRFAAAGKEKVLLVRHVLSHTAGRAGGGW
jgi:CubicO group peptidase (beta-lactamase class C family)